MQRLPFGTCWGVRGRLVYRGHLAAAYPVPSRNPARIWADWFFGYPAGSAALGLTLAATAGGWTLPQASAALGLTLAATAGGWTLPQASAALGLAVARAAVGQTPAVAPPSRSQTTARPLSDPAPLRDTSVWPGYDAIAVIPRVYGRARVAPLRYNATNTRFVLADHAIAGVDRVLLDGQLHAGWRWRNGADPTGHAVAFLELAEPPASGAVLAADIRGLDGNPAAILNNLYPRSDLQDFGIVCRNAGLELGGALLERQTLRAALQFVVEQVGGMWSAGLSGFAALFPPPEDGPLWASFGPLDIRDWSADCRLSDLATRLTVPFDWDYAKNQAQQSLVLEAREARSIYGVREWELALPWVKTARQALATATAYLQWRARPLWTVQFTASVQYRGIPPGGWISLSHPRLPYAGWYVVTDIDPGYGRGGVTITAQASAGIVPSITLVQSSAAF